jgi:hypothetical protein
MGERVSGNISGKDGAVQDFTVKTELEDDGSGGAPRLNRDEDYMQAGGSLSAKNGGNTRTDSGVIQGSYTFSAPRFMLGTEWLRRKATTAQVPPSGGPHHDRAQTKGARHGGRVCSSGWADLPIVRLIVNDEDGRNDHFDSPK